MAYYHAVVWIDHKQARVFHFDVEEATGARGTESQSHLPLSVTTFNTIEGVALLTLCPSEQKLLPSSVRTKIHTLGESLAKRPG